MTTPVRCVHHTQVELVSASGTALGTNGSNTDEWKEKIMDQQNVSSALIENKIVYKLIIHPERSKGGV